MDINLINDFENLKISALNKVKLINNDIKYVTIGPNSVRPNIENNETTIKTNGTKKTAQDKNVIKTNIKNIQQIIPSGKFIVEAEKQRRDEVENNIKSRVATINAKFQQLDSNSKLQWIQRQKMMAEQTRKQEEIMLKVLQEHDKRACDLSEQLHLQCQKQQDERHKRILELQSRDKEVRHLAAVIEAIHGQQIIFRTIYQEIVGILKLSNNPKSINKILASNANIKALPEMIDKIKEKCKTQKVDENDLQKAISLVKEVRNLKSVIAQQVLQLNEQEKIVSQQAKLQAEQERLKAEENKLIQERNEKETELTQVVNTVQQENLPEIPISTQQPIPNTIRIPQKVPNSNIDLKFVSKENLHKYAELQQYLDSYENSFKNIINDPRLKQFKFSLQKAVNIPLNAISSVSSAHLHDKYQRLSNLLSGKNVEAGGSNVSASQHPEGIAFCTNLLARKFVLQGDLMVSSSPESAHCFAAVIVSLWIDFPDFGKLVLAHFYREAPYLVPMYPIMLEGQSQRDYYISLGYHYNDNVVERQDKFLKRMSGIMRLYAAVTVSRLRRAHQGRSHPYGLAQAWSWLASMLNLEPKADITATMVYEFIEVAGHVMKNSYGKQFEKMLIYLNDYLQIIQKIDSGGPMTRLEVLLQKIRQTGQIDLPRGRLSEGFW